MADFEQAFTRTLSWEGGYSCDPLDPGGETLFGIARKKHPEWSGWARVDEIKKHYSGHALATTLKADEQLLEAAKPFFHDMFWEYDGIESQGVANKVYDLGVNCGTLHAVKFLQSAVGVEADGKFGPHTLLATNSANSALVLDKIRILATDYYTSLPGFAHDGHGWLRRLDT